MNIELHNRSCVVVVDADNLMVFFCSHLLQREEAFDLHTGCDNLLKTKILIRILVTYHTVEQIVCVLRALRITNMDYVYQIKSMFEGDKSDDFKNYLFQTHDSRIDHNLFPKIDSIQCFSNIDLVSVFVEFFFLVLFSCFAWPAFFIWELTWGTCQRGERIFFKRWHGLSIVCPRC